jgi:DNA-directed RNA polymerase specialized sigma24 family protein
MRALSSNGWWARFVQSFIDIAGTAVDGEDIVQDALLEALAARPNAGGPMRRALSMAGLR